MKRPEEENKRGLDMGVAIGGDASGHEVSLVTTEKTREEPRFPNVW